MKTILIIEDNPKHLRLAATLLGKSGYAVLEATDAEAGLPLARLRIPDLILMDLQLPGMDGLKATGRLKEDPATRGIPVIAVTSYMPEHPQTEILAVGCAAVIAKPYHYKEFLDIIGALLARRDAGNQPGEST
ncbi:MAG: response regulator [Gammaproteobacteria bacterium]|nr:MAG: response regulator [Gammaproteobacteria bacterium]